MSYKSDLEDVGVDLVHETEKAWLVTDGTIVDGELNRVWVPKSQAELDKTTRPLFTLTAKRLGPCSRSPHRNGF